MRSNAKQPSGGHAGVRKHLAIFLSGKLDRMGATRERCKDAAYEPLPALERLARQLNAPVERSQPALSPRAAAS